ncbi:MAG: cytochrome c, partial [Candidatus Riflebacteria bacterium]
HTAKEKSTPRSAAFYEWRKHNCAACHAVFGLGGHLGPDLTNVISRRPAEYIKAVLQNGMPGMPAFNLTDSEMDSILYYLTLINQEGVYPLQSHSAPVFGKQKRRRPASEVEPH